MEERHTVTTDDGHQVMTKAHTCIA